MDAFGHTESLSITRLGREQMARLAMAGGAVLMWLGVGLIDLFLSAMFFSEPTSEVWFVFSPLLLAAAWIAYMSMARGRVVVRHDALEIHHRRVLRRPLVIPRAQVARILLDDGAATGRARFATGDINEPLLWTDPVPRHQRADVPLVGDSVLPNLAIVLSTPLPMDAARDPITSIPVARSVDAPKRRGNARAVLLAMDDPEAVRAAFAGWPVEQPRAVEAIPPQVAAAAARVPQDAAVMVILAAITAFFMATELYLLAPIAFGVSMFFVVQMFKRRQRAAEAARAEVERRAAFMSPEDRATALAAIEANLGTRRSFGPPGWPGT